jgi:CRISPR/Cas system CMR subunit Cmr4 (Cas7 group RAMP superfamily)
MYKKSAVLTFYAETPIHMGSGQSVSYVDLPISKRKTYFFSSSLVKWNKRSNKRFSFKSME